MLHSAVPAGFIHTPFNWLYASSTDRIAASGFVSGDVNKIALDVDTADAWVLATVNEDGTGTWKSLATPTLQLPVRNTVVSSGAAVAGAHGPVDATAGTVTRSLPAGEAEGTLISVEKMDGTAHAVNLTGNVRGAAAQTLPLQLPHEQVLLIADDAGSWWPIAGHKTLASLDARFVGPGGMAPAGGSAGQEIIVRSDGTIGYQTNAVYADAWGCAGNNATDDTTPMQAAITQVIENGGDLVLTYGKTYKIAGNLHADNNAKSFRIRGGGGQSHMNIGTPTMHFTGSTGSLLTVHSSTGWEVDHIRFTYDPDTFKGAGTHLVDIDWSSEDADVQNWHIHHCALAATAAVDPSNGCAALLRVNHAIIGNIDHCHFGSAQEAIHLGSNYVNVVGIDSCTFNYCQSAYIGIDSTDFESVTISRCAFENCPANGAIYGYDYAASAYNLVIEKNWFGDYDGTFTPTSWINGLSTTSLSYSSTIRDNRFSGISAFHLNLKGMWLIQSNTFEGGRAIYNSDGAVDGSYIAIGNFYNNPTAIFDGDTYGHDQPSVLYVSFGNIVSGAPADGPGASNDRLQRLAFGARNQGFLSITPIGENESLVVGTHNSRDLIDNPGASLAYTDYDGRLTLQPPTGLNGRLAYPAGGDGVAFSWGNDGVRFFGNGTGGEVGAQEVTGETLADALASVVDAFKAFGLVESSITADSIAPPAPQIITESGEITVPPGVTFASMILVAGGGGGAGAGSALTSGGVTAQAGGAGGPGAAPPLQTLVPVTPGDVLTVTVGAGGTGGAGGAVNGNAGAVGAYGAESRVVGTDVDIAVTPIGASGIPINPSDANSDAAPAGPSPLTNAMNGTGWSSVPLAGGPGTGAFSAGPAVGACGGGGAGGSQASATNGGIGGVGGIAAGFVSATYDGGTAPTANGTNGTSATAYGAGGGGGGAGAPGGAGGNGGNGGPGVVMIVWLP